MLHASIISGSLTRSTSKKQEFHPIPSSSWRLVAIKSSQVATGATVSASRSIWRPASGWALPMAATAERQWVSDVAGHVQLRLYQAEAASRLARQNGGWRGPSR